MRATWQDSSSLLRAGSDIVSSVKSPPVMTPAQAVFLVDVASAQDRSLADLASWFAAVQASEAQAFFAALQQQAAPPPAPSGGGGGGSSHQSSGGGGGSGTGGGGGAGGQWAAVRQCESGGNYSENSGNGYYGAYQFSESTWQSLGYSGLPSDAPPSVQDQAAQQLANRSGMGQWPVCG